LKTKSNSDIMIVNYLLYNIMLDIQKSYSSLNTYKSINEQGYASLKNKIDYQGFIYLPLDTGLTQVRLNQQLGCGGCKKALEIINQTALILPNMDANNLTTMTEHWNRIVDEEVKFSQILTQVGLLSPGYQKTYLSLSSEENEPCIPTYFSQTFQSLVKSKNLYIIDWKNRNSSTWTFGHHFLFLSDEERLDPKNWDSVINPLVTDIKKLCKYQIPTNSDSLNIAITRQKSNLTQSPYQTRYFGFDFSNKRTPLSIRELNLEEQKIKYTKTLTFLLDQILFWEFGYRYDCDATLKNFKDILIDRYIQRD